MENEAAKETFWDSYPQLLGRFKSSRSKMMCGLRGLVLFQDFMHGKMAMV